MDTSRREERKNGFYNATRQISLVFMDCINSRRSLDIAANLESSSNRRLVEYEMKKAGIFKSKLALIMYTPCLCSRSIKYRHAFRI